MVTRDTDGSSDGCSKCNGDLATTAVAAATATASDSCVEEICVVDAAAG